MNRKFRLLLTTLLGSLWLAVFLAAVVRAEAKEIRTSPADFRHPMIQAQRDRATLFGSFGVTSTLTPTVQGKGPVSVTQVSPLMVLSGPLPDIPPDYMIVEGDIQIPKSAFAVRYSTGKTGNAPGNQPAGPNGTFETNLWPNGNVPYEFDANVTAANQAAAQQAMTDWQAIANVQFTQCANNTCSGDFVHIQNSNANSSPTGRQGGRQVLNVVNWNSRYIIAHELGHALGLEHEQTRPNRDSFVQINLNNVCKATDTSCNGGFCFDGSGNRIDCDFNFNIHDTALTYGTYDFDSVMHYGRTAFSRNGNDTITVLPPYDTQWQNVIGQRTHLSQADQNAMGCLYPFSNWRWVSTIPFPTPMGNCFFPYSGFVSAFAATPAGGLLWIEPGSYSATGTYNKNVTLKAPNGLVVLGQ